MPESSNSDVRRPWIEPELTSHESLSAMTQRSRLDPATGRVLDPKNPRDAIIIQQIPGSGGFFP